MLLQQLKLQNIRSYLDQTIDFSEGSTLLSGDIGSGKSTILLAIEFALFGTSRPDLPGEALLRKGSTQGSVELNFRLSGQDIIIKRSLKKDKNAIKQLAGYITVNNIKKDLTPVELKAEIISLLGYPEELVTKNKNYIFRYTVYTPQEEMKFILQENPETRLDVLRKIFNIDKYKNVRENLQTYLKQMRTDIAVLKTKTEPLEQHKNYLLELKKEKEQLNLELNKLTPHFKKIKEELQQQKENLKQLEQQQQYFLEFKQQYKTTLALTKEKIEQNQELLKKEEELKLHISQIKVETEDNYEQIKQKITELEKQKNEFLTQKSSRQEKLNHLQQKIEEAQVEINRIKEETLQIEEKEELKQRLTTELAEKNELEKKRKQLEELWEKTSQLVTKNQTLLSQSKELQEKIKLLDKCPTCLQEVPENHKGTISSQEGQKTKQAENLLFELNKKKVQISEQKSSMQEKIEQLIRKENLLTRTKLELLQLNEKKEGLHKKQEQLKSWVQENNNLMQQLQKLEKEDKIEKINRQIDSCRDVLDSYSKKKLLEQQLTDLNARIKENEKQLGLLNEKISCLESQLADKKDCSKEIESKRKSFEVTLQNEKELSVKQARLQTELDNLMKQEDQLEKELTELNEQRERLVRLKELYHWLEGHFLKLTYTIEKQVMLNIHYLFNQLFQEWFSTLIDDDNVYSRLDDSFTPVIEQNGYEISFHNLSGGEKTSAALSYRLALNKVINDVIGGIKTKDLLILDEPTDGFSSEQLDKVRDVLDRLNLRQTVIVSHESKIESFVENVIRVSKSEHVSGMV